jgi:hypothetical protein
MILVSANGWYVLQGTSYLVPRTAGPLSLTASSGRMVPEAYLVPGAVYRLPCTTSAAHLERR